MKCQIAKGGRPLAIVGALLSACAQAHAPSEWPGECNGPVCEASAPAVTWDRDNPVYFAHLRVVDAAGKPVDRASVRLEKQLVLTDKQGRARVGPISARVAASVRIEKAGLMPQLAVTSPFRAAHLGQTIAMPALSVDSAVDPARRIVLAGSGASITLPPRALADYDGRRVISARAELTFLGASAAAERLFPVATGAVDGAGRPTLMRPWAVLFARFRDPANMTLEVAPGAVARIELPVPADAARDGEVVPLWRLDRSSGLWNEHGSCEVSRRPRGSGSEQICSGRVDQFAHWAVGPASVLPEAASLGCVNATARSEQGACFGADVQSLQIYACDEQGGACRLASLRAERFSPAASDLAWCGALLRDSPTFRLAATYDAETSGCGEDAPGPGRRMKVSEPFALPAQTAGSAADLLRSLSESGDLTCESRCTAAELVLSTADLAAPLLFDRDGDGFYARSDGGEQMLAAFDCDDQRRDVYPGAAEPFCVREDLDCDGEAPPPYKSYAEIDAVVWNASCRDCERRLKVKLPRHKELAGNLHDEDCDGTAADLDGDGVPAPADCDDQDARIHPGASELAGNGRDDDCDDVDLDGDGDGFYALTHAYLAGRYGLDPVRFSDCDDADADVNPAVPVSEEAGALRALYEERAGVVWRLPWFCELFDELGAPSPRYYQQVRDLNCDGRFSDLDGDGYTAPGDLALGAALASDCDDLDPRIQPRSASDPTCVAAPDLANDALCESAPAPQPSGGCPVLTLSGTKLVTTCDAIKRSDGSSTGLGGCSFPGWWEGSPFSLLPGTAWGPCDGKGPLADCPSGTRCAGRLAYAPAITSYFESTFLAGEPLSYAGMCFPACTP